MLEPTSDGIELRLALANCGVDVAATEDFVGSETVVGAAANAQVGGRAWTVVRDRANMIDLEELACAARDSSGLLHRPRACRRSRAPTAETAP